ncbi:MAG: restriction endonuclease subunit S [Pirellulales bacterium]
MKLGEIATMKYGKLPPKETNADAAFPIFTGYRIAGFCDEYLYDEPEVIVVARGVGGTGDVKISPEKSWITNLSIVLSVDATRINKRFLFYRLGQESLKDKLNTGAAQAQITIENLRPYSITIPSVATQERIANTLSAYDDLIENNRRRMRLLEDGARALYREWFVRLRFPGHEHTRIINGVPQGWESKTLGELCEEVREAVKPEGLARDTPYIGLEHMPRRSISLDDWGNAQEVTSSKHRFREDDILFGKIRPYFHKVGIAFINGVASSDAIVIRPPEARLRGFVLMTVSSDPFVAVTAQTMREGSKMPRADWKQMQAYPTPLPPDALLGTFESTVRPIVEQLRALTLGNQKLRAARDLLLPQLMTGEIAV